MKFITTPEGVRINVVSYSKFTKNPKATYVVSPPDNAQMAIYLVEYKDALYSSLTIEELDRLLQPV
jgi:hypothetical protein